MADTATDPQFPRPETGGSPLHVTVLGKSPSWQDTDGACSGYLIEHAHTRLLLDCGNGVFAKLRQACDYTQVDAVVVSHLHADHVLDLVPYSYALLHAPRPRESSAQRPRPPLFAPPGAAEMFRRLVGSWGPEELIESAFTLQEYDPETELPLGSLGLRFCEVPHFTRTFAVRLGATGAGQVTYSADCGPNSQLVEFARNSDLLLIEATLAEPDRPDPRGHLTPREAGELARAAGARRVVLTHFTDELDAGWLRDEASAGFGAAVELAREGAAYSV